MKLSHSVMSDSVIPWTVAHQAPLSMGFSRQEFWSGFPFPSPGDLPDPGIKSVSPALQAVSLSLSHQEVKVKVTQFCPTLCDPMECSSPGYSVHRISQAKILEWVAISFSRGSSHREIKLMSPALAGGFFTAKPPGKPSPTQYAILLSLASSVKTQGPPVPQL